MRGRLRLPALTLLTVSVLLTGCAKSGDEEGAATDEASPAATSSAEPGKADGTYSGAFRLVDNPPEGTDDVTGTATMLAGEDGTEVSLDVEGLEDKAGYVAFVYNDACAAADPGGGHFTFDPDSTAESNMIHLKIEIKDGKGTATTKSKEQATTAARSVIIHMVRAADAKKDEKNPPKIACADLVKE